MSVKGLEETSKILIVRLSSLGDIVLTTPVYEQIKRKFLSGNITVLVKKKFAPILEGNPHINHVLTFDSQGLWGMLREIRRNNYDVYIDLHDTFRSRFWGFFSGISRRVRYHKLSWDRRFLVWFKKKNSVLNKKVIDRYLEALSFLGITPEPGVPRVYIGEKKKLHNSLEKRLGVGPFIGVAPGALHETKQWPSEKFARAVDEINKRLFQSKASVVVIGASSDQKAVEGLLGFLEGSAQNFSGQTSIIDMSLLMKKCSLILTNDSGAMHVAAAMDVPIISIFGPTVREFGFFPTGKNVAVIENKELPCRPCSLHGQTKCPLKHFRCMEDIKVNLVVEKAQELLKLIST